MPRSTTISATQQHPLCGNNIKSKTTTKMTSRLPSPQRQPKKRRQKNIKRLRSLNDDDDGDDADDCENALLAASQSPSSLPRPKKLMLHQASRFKEFHHQNALSPISEISINLSEACLNTPNDGAEMFRLNKRKSKLLNDLEGGEQAGGGHTPVKSWRNSPHEADAHKRHFKQFKNILQENANSDDLDADAIETSTAFSSLSAHQHFMGKLDNEDEDSLLGPPSGDYSTRCDDFAKEGFQMPRQNMSARSMSRRLNMDSSMDAVEEISFYEDDMSALGQQRSFTASPQLMGLLSPEGSPQRFQIVEKPLSHSKKFLQSSSRRSQQKLNNASNNLNASSTNTSSNTPSKSFRMFHSLSSGSMESSMDDEYMELFEMEALDQQQNQLNFPSNLNSLISGHIKSSNSPAVNAFTTASPTVKTPEMRRPSVRRCLSMTENQRQTPSTPEFLKPQENSATTPSFKRPEPPSLSASPVQSKRLRCQEKENLESPSSTTCNVMPAAARAPFRRYVSMNDAQIMTALDRSESKGEPDLIGDFSKPFVLPLMDGRHRDLKSVSSNTVARLLNGEFREEIASYKIIDCRYPYEFEGGHIRGAKNLYTQEQVLEEFLKNKTEHTDASGKRNIIIFHCEFSSERGPKLSRFLRSNDRERNTNQYPILDFPEIYLLHNGYKEFYETHAELCDPIAYRPMLEPSYSEAYRHFRAKSKSWNGDGLGGATSRLKKSRSRLML